MWHCLTIVRFLTRCAFGIVDVSRGVNRDSFAIDLGGFDTHFDLKSVLELKFKEIGPVLKGFRDELVNLGLWDGITVVVSSEFGRTVTPNTSAGTDHGWGGHHMIMGGKVSGSMGVRVIGYLLLLDANLHVFFELAERRKDFRSSSRHI